MTISVDTSKIEYNADGVQTSFAYTFPVYKTNEMKVYLDGVLATTGYTVTGIGSANGGSVDFAIAPANSVVVTLRRVSAKVQELVLREFQKIPVAAVEKNFDKIVAMIQELAQSDSDINVELDGLQIQLDDLLAFLQSIALQPSAQYVGETRPEFEFRGMRWYKPSEATTFIYFTDGDSGQWVQEPVVPADTSLPVWYFTTPSGIDTTGVVDATSIISAALASSDFVALPAGDIKITSNINIAGKVLIGKGKDKTRLICSSPTGDNRFGGSATNQAALYSRGTNGNPVQGASVSDLTVVCNGLFNSSGSTGLKGVMFYKSHGCHAKRVRVVESSSYAFWCADADTGTDYASAIFEDCDETGSEIGFEAVNVSNCQFIRCTSLKPSALSSWPVFSMFHAYALKDDALVIFDNCYGKGYSSTVIDLVLKCRNIQFKGGYFEQLNPANSAFFLTNTASDYLSVEFGSAVFKSAGFGGVLSSGSLGTAGQKAVKFIGGSIKAMGGVGIELQSDNATYEFVGTDVESNAGTAAGLCFLASVSGNTVQFTGGSLQATGGVGTTVSQNVSMRVSSQTIQIPSDAQIPQIRQLVFGETALINDGGNSFFNALFPYAADMSKVQVSAFINAEGAADGAEAAAQATLISFIPLNNQVVRFYAATAASGRKVRWQLVEYV